MMSAWFEPLLTAHVKNDDSLLWLTERSWFPSDAVILISENGRMESRLTPLVMKHINKFDR